MSSIVTGILRSTVGFLLNKARDATANVTDAKIRGMIVRELDDVKTKIDALARTDLHTSYNDLQEGVLLLTASLDETKNELTASLDETKDVVNESEDERGEASRMPSGGVSDILNEALELSHAMGKLKIASANFETAKNRFTDARKEARRVFFNESLNIEDRIFAAKLRVVSEILECLESPQTAVISCLFFLEKLHGLPAVREIFSVYIGRGVMSKLNKAERVKNVKSIMMINYILYQFVSRYSSKSCLAITWPSIQLSDRSFNPICNWREISERKSWGEDLVQPPNEIRPDEYILGKTLAINSRGEILMVGYRDNISVIYKTGKGKQVWELSASTENEENVIEQRIAGLAVDEENNVYVVVYFKKTSGTSLLLYVLDDYCFHVKHTSQLNFVENVDDIIIVSLAINKNNNIVIHIAPHVYVCDQTGQLKYKFGEDIPSGVDSCTSVPDNEIMLAPITGDAVEIYTEEGNLKLKIKLPEFHVIMGAAFHFVLRKIMVLGYMERENSSFLHCYSETGKLETSMRVPFTSGIPWFYIISHPSGPVAIVGYYTINYI